MNFELCKLEDEFYFSDNICGIFIFIFGMSQSKPSNKSRGFHCGVNFHAKIFSPQFCFSTDSSHPSQIKQYKRRSTRAHNLSGMQNRRPRCHNQKLKKYNVWCTKLHGQKTQYSGESKVEENRHFLSDVRNPTWILRSEICRSNNWMT